jgi:erythronate-4-phosphate dehydrogenase
MLKITIDENISHAKEAFSQLGEVELFPGRMITKDKLSKTDILIIRSVTNVTKELLSNTPVKFVGTATIGTDHVDIEYLKTNNIAFTDAKGCNANAVAEYVFTAITEIINRQKFKFNNLTLGVVGVGNIGSKVVKLGKMLGMNILQNDPPLKRLTKSNEFIELDDLLKKSDIITFHVPLNLAGVDKTIHLLNSGKFSLIRNKAVIINSSRGGVVDNAAMANIIDEKSFTVVLDVWENEPAINLSLLKNVLFATPHIAGYSYEGKVNGTKMIYDALCNFLSIKPEWQPKPLPVEDHQINIEQNYKLEELFNKILRKIYKIEEDDDEMKKMLMMNKKETAKHFDSLRKHYPLRREFLNYTVRLKEQNETLTEILKNFRFNVKNF